MRVIYFWREGCPKCPEAKALLDQLLPGRYASMNVDSRDGMAEAAMYAVMSTPSIIILDSEGNEVVGWRGTVPTKQELKSWISA